MKANEIEEQMDRAKSQKVKALKILWSKRRKEMEYKALVEKLQDLSLYEMDKNIREIEELVRNMVLGAGAITEMLPTVGLEDITMFDDTRRDERLQAKWFEEMEEETSTSTGSYMVEDMMMETETSLMERVIESEASMTLCTKSSHPPGMNTTEESRMEITKNKGTKGSRDVLMKRILDGVENKILVVDAAEPDVDIGCMGLDYEMVEDGVMMTKDDLAGPGYMGDSLECHEESVMVGVSPHEEPPQLMMVMVFGN